MTVKLLTDYHLEFLSLKGGCTGSSESTLVKMPHCRKLHVTAQLFCYVSKGLSTRCEILQKLIAQKLWPKLKLIIFILLFSKVCQRSRSYIGVFEKLFSQGIHK